MDNNKFIEYLNICGKMGSMEKKYIDELRMLDMDLKEAWMLLERLDRERVVSINIISAILGIRDTYKKSSYNKKMDLSEFFREYVKNFCKREKYILSPRGITYAMGLIAHFTSTRYFNDFEELRILKDESFSTIKVYLGSKKVTFSNNGVDDMIKIGDGKDFGEAVFIKDNTYEIMDIDDIEEYPRVVERALDNKSYDIMLLPYIVQSKENNIMRVCIDKMDLDNSSVARICKMITLVGNMDTEVLRKTEHDVVEFMSMMLRHGINLSDIVSMLSYIGTRNDIEESKRFLMIHSDEVKKNGIEYMIDKYEL